MTLVVCGEYLGRYVDYYFAALVSMLTNKGRVLTRPRRQRLCLSRKHVATCKYVALNRSQNLIRT